jgi:hypothetical protein
MKKFVLSLVVIATISLSLFSQAPEGFKYQAVVRDAGNLILKNQAVGMRMTIQQGSIGGTTVYQETFAPFTNAYGLVNLEIGSGTVVSGDFKTIAWADGLYFIETAVDITGGISYALMGTSQLMSVPFALYANTAENVTNDMVDDADADPSNEMNIGIVLNGTDLEVTDGNGTIVTNLTRLQNVYTAGKGIDITDNKVSTVGCTYSIGDLVPALGGYIFYLDGSGCRGLVAKSADEPSLYQWSSIYFDTWAFAIGPYGGAQNTQKIKYNTAQYSLRTSPAAAQASLQNGSFNDWYLPSKDELNIMYLNLYLQGVGNFVDNYYWSSSEHDMLGAWTQGFRNGAQYIYTKSSTNYVRAVRAF